MSEMFARVRLATLSSLLVLRISSAMTGVRTRLVPVGYVACSLAKIRVPGGLARPWEGIGLLMSDLVYAVEAG